MFEGFHYTNFHELNIDWIIKIAKDFLDQYTHIQETITQGLEDLDTKAQQLQAALDAWYDEHSEDIANQLADALQDLNDWYTTHQGYLDQYLTDSITAFNNAADAKAAETIESIPADYTELSNDVLNLNKIKTNHAKNLYDYNDPDIETGGFYLSSGTWYAMVGQNETGYIPCTPGKRYKKGEWLPQSYNSHVVFYDSSKTYISGVSSTEPGYVTAPLTAAYMRFSVSDADLYRMVIIEGYNIITPFGLPYNVETTFDDEFRIGDCLVKDDFESAEWTPYDISGRGALKTNGTIATQYTSLVISKYKVVSDIIYMNGQATIATAGTDFTDLWFVSNGSMIAEWHVENGTMLNDLMLRVPSGADEIWTSGAYLKVHVPSAIDRVTREFMKDIQSQGAAGAQWVGKSWYAYGTSITSVHDGTGKYPTYLAQMSGMVLTEKGIGGGGIGDLGAYSRGQVYDAICNITDGKLNADIITLETGANDVNASVPLGTVYDTGRTTLCGCLNDCIRYLQENTTAQIVIMNSPYATTFPTAADQVFKWRELMKEICFLNGVHFIDTSCNLGTAKIASSQGSLYVVDNIHPTDLGGYIYAQNVWYQLRNIPNFYTVMP